jgi:hypothetical protein
LRCSLRRRLIASWFTNPITLAFTQRYPAESNTKPVNTMWFYSRGVGFSEREDNLRPASSSFVISTPATLKTRSKPLASSREGSSGFSQCFVS